MNGPMTYFSERSRSSLLSLTMQAFPMKETMHFIWGGKNQLLGIPTLFLDPKMKNDFWVQRTFKVPVLVISFY